MVPTQYFLRLETHVKLSIFHVDICNPKCVKSWMALYTDDTPPQLEIFTPNFR